MKERQSLSSFTKNEFPFFIFDKFFSRKLEIVPSKKLFVHLSFEASSYSKKESPKTVFSYQILKFLIFHKSKKIKSIT